MFISYVVLTCPLVLLLFIMIVYFVLKCFGNIVLCVVIPIKPLKLKLKLKVCYWSVALLCLCFELLTGGQYHRHTKITVAAIAKGCKNRSEINSF